MTIDDDSSVYVGGLSLDFTEDTLRKVFEEYGGVVAVKIICDRESGSSLGYGFVTFTNSRAATKAINGMDGGSIDGRTVRVNEVRNRNSKALGRPVSLRDRGRIRNTRDIRNRDWTGNSRRFSPSRMRRSSPKNLRSTRARLPAQHRSRSPQAGQSPSRNSSQDRHENRNSRSLSPRSSDRNLYRHEEGLSGHPKPISRATKDRQTDLMKVRDDLDRANQRREELIYKVTSLEEEFEEKEREVAELQGKSQKLEDALEIAVAASSQRLLQLKKLQRAFLQVTDHTERLKSSEKELQELFNGIIAEANNVVAEGIWNESTAIGVTRAGLEEEGDVDVDI